MHTNAARLRRRLLAAATAVAATALCGGALAQAAWPSKPVKIMVGFPGGSTPDLAARALADVLAKSLGQPVVVENRPGASGNIAADQVSKASDDHTLGVVINGNLTSARLLNPSLPYDPAKDFSFVSLLATAPLVLVAPPDLPAGAEFFNAARNSAGKWSYGSVGIGSVGHLGMEYVKSQAGNFEAVHVPYNGNPAVITAHDRRPDPDGADAAGHRAAAGQGRQDQGHRPDRAAQPDGARHAVAGRAGHQDGRPGGLGGAGRPGVAEPRGAGAPGARSAGARWPARRASGCQAGGWQGVGSSADGLRQRVARETEILGGIIKSRGIKIE